MPSLQAQLATGMMLLGAVVPDSARRLSKVAPSAVFDSILKVWCLIAGVNVLLCPLRYCHSPALFLQG